MKRLLLVLLLSASLNGATYTVGPSETYTTFAAAFAAIDLDAGDILEARAATPGGSATFTETITPGSDDYGTTGNPVIIRARSGDTITIDAEATRNNCIYHYDATGTRDCVTFDGFVMVGANAYSVYINGGSGAYLDEITVQNCNITIDNNAATANSHQGIYAQYADDLLVYQNTITTDDASMNYQTDGIYLQNCPTVVIDGNSVTIRNDHNTPHCDNIQFANIQALTYDHTIRNNTLNQDNASTANKQGIYYEYAKAGTIRIYNNLLIQTGSTGSYAIQLAPKAASTQVAYILNNTMWNNGSSYGIKTDAYTDNPYIQNNIWVNETTGADVTSLYIESSTVTSSRINNNIHYTANATQNNLLRDSGGFKSWANWQAAGYDVNGYNADPSLASPPSDCSVGSGSNAVDAGADWSSLFTTDIAGTVRPQNIVYDIGAYEYESGGGAPATAPGATIRAETVTIGAY